VTATDVPRQATSARRRRRVIRYDGMGGRWPAEVYAVVVRAAIVTGAVSYIRQSDQDGIPPVLSP
jgi:hypothetical protein